MNNRNRLLAKIYSRDYKKAISGKGSVYYGIHDLYPPLHNFKTLPRKKKKQAFKDLQNDLMKPKYTPTIQDINYCDTDIQNLKETLFSFYISNRSSHKKILNELYGKPKEE